MKKELQNKDNGLGFLRHWKVMTMTLLLLTFSIGNVWGGVTFSAQDFLDAKHDNTEHATCSAASGLTLKTGDAQLDYYSSNKLDGIQISSSTTNQVSKASSYVEVKADKGYAVSSIEFKSVVANNSDAAIAVVGWVADINSTSCDYFATPNFPKKNNTSAPSNTTVSFTGDYRTIRIYRQILINGTGNTFESSGDSYKRGAGKSINLFEAIVTTKVAPVIEGDEVMLKSETITLTGYPSGGTWAIESGTAATINATTGALTSGASSGDVQVSYTVSGKKVTHDVSVLNTDTKTLCWNFTKGEMPTACGITAQGNGAFNEYGYNLAEADVNFAYVDVTSAGYEITAANLSIFPGGTGTKTVKGDFKASLSEATSDGWQISKSVSTKNVETDYGAIPDIPTGCRVIRITKGNTGCAVGTLCLTVKKYVAPATYTVTLNPEGGSIDPVPSGWTLTAGQYVKSGIEDGSSVALLALTKDDYLLEGWKDGENADYTSPVTVTGDLTLTAQWASAHTVSFAANGGGSSMSPVVVKDGTTYTIPACGFTPEDANHTFSHWVISGVVGKTEGDPDETFTMPAGDVTLTAQWAVSYDVTKGSHTNGDFTISPASGAAGTEITLSATGDEGYMFGSWEVVKTSDGSASGVTVTNNKFNLPAFDVTVNATFVTDTRKKVLILVDKLSGGNWTGTGTDKLYAALKDAYNVTVAVPDGQTLTDYDLIVLHESIGGSNTNAAVTGCKTTSVPVLNTKTYFYGGTNDASSRWQWGAPNGGQSIKGCTLNSGYCNAASHPIFADVTINEGFVEIINTAEDKCMQPVVPVSGKEGYLLATSPNAATPGGNGYAIQEIPAGGFRGATSGKYLLISASNGALSKLNANGQKLFQNAAAYLLDGDASWSPATAPTSPAIEATGGAIHAVGDAVTMTASASNVSATTLYAWYKGETLEAAEEAGAIQTAKTAAAGGTTYSIASCELASAGRYWCVIVNAEGCEASASLELSVSSTPITTYDITYVSAKGTAPDPDNAASVTLAEITGVSGWEHQGWKANVDVVVDDATVTANTLIANGKTAVLSADVTFTAVWRQVLTVTYNANGGTCGTASATWGEGDAALVLPDVTPVANLVFDGWYTEATGGILIGRAGGSYTPTADIEIFAHFGAKLYQAVYANGFDAFINQSTKTVTVYYLDGTPAPALTSVKAMKADGSAVADGTFVDNGATIDVTIDEKTATYTVTKTAVAPYTYVNGDPITFDGTETYIKTGNAFSTASGKEGWKFSKNDNDWSRETPGNNRIYFFIGAAESITLTSGCSSARAIKVYRNGTQIFDNTMPKNSASPNYITLTGSNAPAMYAIVSNQTDGDGAIKIMALAPWVSTTAVVLKEGESAISEKEIWAGANFTLTAEVTPDNASNKTITWTSSNPAVATVVNGVVTGVAANASPVTITASTVDGVTATCAVTVTAAPSPCETPTITTHPATQAYCAGSEPTLSVVASVTDGGTLHYAWYKVGDPDAAVGTDAASYNVESAGTYYVIVTNKKDGSLDASATSSNAVVTMNVAAAITTQPTGKSEVVSGSSVTLSVVATNATGYQWYICDDAEKTNAAVIPGEIAANYTFSCTANGYYYCVVGSACGDDIASNVVSVKLEPAGCNLIASIPSFTGDDNENYWYEQRDALDNPEWTLYGITSKGKLEKGTNRFTDSAKDFDDNDVNAITDQRVGMTFAKDIESLTIYATSTSTGRVWKSDQQIQVTTDDITISTNPTYVDVTADRAVATMPTNNKQYIFTADNMLIEAGKKVWLPFSGAVTIFKICYTAALEKCDAPVLPSLASKELCEGEAITAWDATSTVSDGGTLSYQWYNGDTDEALSGEDDAEFTPSADGNYYVIVTNKKTGYRDNTTKSATLSVEHFAGTAITEGLVDLRGVEATVVTLTVTATGKALHYAWKESATIDGTYTDVAGAADAASLDVTITDGMSKYYKVVVSGGCGAAQESIAKVEEYVAVSQQDVTGSIVWDWTEAASVNEIKLTSGTTPKKNEGFVMANGAATIYNNANFESDKLYLEGEYIVRDSKFFQGQTIKFNTTVDGLVRVKFSHTGDSKPARELFINGVGTGDSRTSATAAWSRYVEVPAGEVVITAYHVDPADGAGQQYIRIPEIEFLALADRRAGTWVKPGELGTVCLKDDAKVVGAKVYALQGVNEYGYMAFDELGENEDLVAGTPYLFEAQRTGNVSFYKTVGADHTETAGDVKGMYGTFADIEFTPNTPESENIYYFSGTHIWKIDDFTVNITVPAYRCYVNYEEFKNYPVSAAPLPGRRRMSIGVNGKNTPTGIENGELINGENGVQKVLINGELFILRGEKMYDATGRLVK